jgi:diaminopimelate decarboxylase
MERIASIDIKQLTEQYGTPLYVYDKSKIIKNYTNLKSAFTNYYPDTDVHFSVKANSNYHILEVLNNIGSGADCSSPVEYLLARKAGFDDSKILYTGNYESREDFGVLKDSKVRINLDDISSFNRLKSVFTPEIVSFRINPGIGRGGFEGITTGGADAKFGVPYENIPDAYEQALKSGITRFGIHMMTGSNNLEPYFFVEVIEKLMNIAGRVFPKLGIIPEYFDIGGGYGVPYGDEDEELNLDTTAKMISEIFIEKCDKYGFGRPKLLLEPGRYIVANAGYLLAKVTGIKYSYKTFLGIDAGMNTLIRPALYGAKHRTYIYGRSENKSNVNICGQICENSDILSKSVFMPKAEEGDIVAITDAGAYGYVMASNYNNRLRPAEVLVDGAESTLIRRRESVDDIMRLYE